MSRSVGSAPIPHADTAAAPAPAAPRTFRKRRRSSESEGGGVWVISIVAHAAVATHLVRDVTAYAPSHPQGGDLVDLRHFLDVAVARDAGLGTEPLDVSHVREVDEAGHRMNPEPLGRLSLAPRVADFLDLRLVRRRGSTHELVASHAGLQRGHPRLTRDGRREMAIHAGDLVLTRMNVVAKEDRLARPLQPRGVGDDGGTVTLWRRSWLCLLTVDGHRREGEEQHHDRSWTQLDLYRLISGSVWCGTDGHRMYAPGGMPHKGYSGRANTVYFRRTTSTNACTDSRSANSIQQWRTPWTTVPSRTACLITRGSPFVALISCSSGPDSTNVPLTPDCIGWR